jgi:hypothetical protein
VNGEGNLLWSVINVEDTTAVDPDTAEESTTRQVLLETSTREDPILRNITRIEVVTLLVHPEVYRTVQLVNLLSIVSGEAGVTQVKDEGPEEQDAKDPPEDFENGDEDPNFRAPEEGDFAYEDYMTRKHQEDFMRADTDDDEPPSKSQKRSQGGVSSSHGARPKSNCSTVNSQDPDQRAAIQ